MDAALGDDGDLGRDRGQQREGGVQRRLEGLEVAVVDAEQGRREGEGGLDLRRIVHLDQHVHAEVPRERVELGERARVERGDDEQDAVRAERARLEHLPGVDDEVLAQRRQGGGVAGRRQVRVVALEVALVGEDGKAGGPGGLVGAGDADRLELGPDHALARGGLLDLRDNARATIPQGRGEPPGRRRRLGGRTYLREGEGPRAPGHLRGLVGEDLVEDRHPSAMTRHILTSSFNRSRACPEAMTSCAIVTPSERLSVTPAA